jgi:hypothetical protein
VTFVEVKEVKSSTMSPAGLPSVPHCLATLQFIMGTARDPVRLSNLGQDVTFVMFQ